MRLCGFGLLYSITSSARARSTGGIVSLRVRAAARVTIVSVGGS
jgi:hypothetical protein